MCNLRSIYREHSKANAYWLGFVNKHEQVVYAFVASFDQLAPFLVDDVTAANENGERFPCIRYKVGRNRDKLEAGFFPDYERPEAIRRICTEGELKAYAKREGVNLGEAFEVLACEKLKLRRNEDPRAAWYEGPDAWRDGLGYQIGFEGKTFTYTAQVERMGWA